MLNKRRNGLEENHMRVSAVRSGRRLYPIFPQACPGVIRILQGSGPMPTSIDT
ncbi:hypothetical protein V474_11620 [Novosphingobium barchaimii LL02]|uniref:Uncharacterized protein n=1 Tax=Novosphingobium barchaimii LL02 TaxID=1114963 RepID=A0A0J8B0Y3_9SPHN|nr:hypothetical protein V474_11620 [Novosphingobium barchaimii LL02]